MRRLIYLTAILMCTIAFSNAVASNYVELNINCPVEKDIYMCEPVTVPPPMKIEDFNVIRNNEVAFQVKETRSQFRKYTVTQYDYIFTDAQGNEANCTQKYYIPDSSINPPTLSKTINLCQNNPWSLIEKPIKDDYNFYADYKGSMGKLVSTCESSDIWCLAINLGVNTTKTGTYKFWVTNVLKEKYSLGNPGFVCESEPVLITMKVNPKPSAVLKKDPIIMEMGEFMNLMDMVEDNKGGVWKGSDIFSFKSVSDDQYFYYFPRKTGLHKLYYTVDNGACKNTYTMVIEVFSPRKSADALNVDDFTVFPNPTSGNAFVNLSNSIDVAHTISVYDVFGKQHIHLSVNDVKNSIFELDVNHLPNGIYMVEVRNPFSHSSKKLMIE